jgi:hypothetical protein
MSRHEIPEAVLNEIRTQISPELADEARALAWCDNVEFEKHITRIYDLALLLHRHLEDYVIVPRSIDENTAQPHELYPE